ncbi:hypothetical protein H2200_008462 [Cladophialophora chaetospira]|uniref:RING-type domain-containing protein n=1 Tax=Cladophialophora chaetospira TaxID=386627 RepID=A0AA39CG47_9EURO|nr:hypothetical protein H2200_008462 [Cladophialophora chaetospira]
MATQGSPNLVVREVLLDINRPFADIDHLFYNTEGYVGIRFITLAATHDNGAPSHDLVYTFRTTADAMAALLNHPSVNIGGATYFPQPYYGDFGESQTNLGVVASDQPVLDLDISPPLKRRKKEAPVETKLTCKICYNELEGPYSTPCRRCKNAICYECLSSQFRTAVKDIDRMPATCCGAVMHHDVAKGVLPAAELENYKQKYDERINAQDPLYCPVPTCSTFIPPRMFKHNDSKIACHVCGTVVCTKCKQHAQDAHECAKEDQRKFILETFHYKLCPRCGTGVMRMHGCPHIRCQCGAHWCWDCQRPMNACYQKPCQAAREEGNYSDGDDGDPESDDENTANLPEIVNAPVMTEPQTSEITDVEQAAADTLIALRDGPVVHVAPADSQVVDSVDNVISTETASSNVTVAAEDESIDSVHRIQMGALGRTEADTTIIEAEAPVAGQNEHPRMHSLAPDDSTVPSVQPPPNAPGPIANNPATNAPVTEETVERVENLDDPNEFEWETRGDFGDEPTDETWDVWGCRHHFYNLNKDRVPQFWLVGVHPTTDAILEIECMGCFKKTKAWDDDAELEAFKVDHGQKDLGAVKTASKQRLADWKAKHPEPVDTDIERKKLASRMAVECRHGCGVIYCPSCKKASRRRIRKERVTGDVDD